MNIIEIIEYRSLHKSKGCQIKRLLGRFKNKEPKTNMRRARHKKSKKQNNNDLEYHGGVRFYE